MVVMVIFVVKVVVMIRQPDKPYGDGSGKVDVW